MCFEYGFVFQFHRLHLTVVHPLFMDEADASRSDNEQPSLGTLPARYVSIFLFRLRSGYQDWGGQTESPRIGSLK